MQKFYLFSCDYCSRYWKDYCSSEFKELLVHELEPKKWVFGSTAGGQNK